MRPDPQQVIAFRVAGHGLARREGSALDAAASWALQDSPPGSAALAVAARAAEFEPGGLERALEHDKTLLATWNPRTALAVVPTREAASFLAALDPPDEASLHELVQRGIPDQDMSPQAAVEATVAVIREALAGRTLSRDELHQALREQLPPSLLPWCEACQSHHARRWLLVAACLRGELCLAGRAGRQPAFARPADWLGAALPEVDRDTAAAELVRRYLHRYGPSTPALLATWAGLPRAQAERAWALVGDELAPAGGGWILEADRERFAVPASTEGMRLLPPGDPLLLDRDRDVLVADPARRKRVWSQIGSPGVLLADGRLAGAWRARKQGKRLALTVEPFASLSKATRAQIDAEAEAVAPHRGCGSASVSYA